MQVVLVEFAVGPDRLDACHAAVEKLTREYVALQPAFHSARIHRQEDTGTLWNIMEWDTHQAFIDFRDGIGADRIAAELGEFGPAGRMLDLVAVVEPDRS